MLNWDEVMRLLSYRDCDGQRTDLAVLRDMLIPLGSPQNGLRFIHVAGTNGKGSASRMLQEILTRAGYRTGRFISPHLRYMNERWTIDGEMISDDDLRDAALRTRDAVAQYNARHKEVRPAAFSLLTLMAFDYFARKGCDIVVLEVGIGGRLDSTNVIPVPELALIMNLGLEHTELLGNTLEEIAFEKGGIIKPGGDVVLYHQCETSESVIRRLCAERGARLTVTEPEALRIRSADTVRISSDGSAMICPSAAADTGTGAGTDNTDRPAPAKNGREFLSPLCSYHSHSDISFRLSGLYQRQNMLTVLDGIDVLRGRGWQIPESAVRGGLAAVTWPGRFEILCRDPLVIVDGAHNPNGIAALVRNLRDPLGPCAGKRFLFVFGAMADKDVEEMLRLLSPLAEGFIMETVADARGADAMELYRRVRNRYQGPVTAVPSLGDALSLATGTAAECHDMAVICCGSLYQVAAVREYYGCE